MHDHDVMLPDLSLGNSWLARPCIIYFSNSIYTGRPSNGIKILHIVVAWARIILSIPYSMAVVLPDSLSEVFSYIWYYKSDISSKKFLLWTKTSPLLTAANYRCWTMDDIS